MPNMMQSGLSWLAGQLKTHASTAVTYRRGASSAGLLATLGSKLLRLETAEGGSVVEWTDLDLILTATDLDLGAGPVLPERGDRVEVASDDDGQVRTYEVLPYANEPPYRWTDPHRTMLRIHCKHVGTAPYS